MLALGLDTSEPRGGVALFDGVRLASERWMDEPLRHAEQLFPLVKRILDESGRRRGQIGLVCVNRGPGSFTGLRIGLAAAKGFCQAVGAALVGVDGAQAYRARILEAKRVGVVVASRRDLYYVQFFAGSRPRGAMRMLHRQELIEALRGEGREVTLVGSGAGEIVDAVRACPSIRVAPEEANRPSALWIAKLGWTEQPANELYELEPSYVEPVLT
jgi:tRNA threonylcarbamoyladenosine biosynthesis protein TsaB